MNSWSRIWLFHIPSRSLPLPEKLCPFGPHTLGKIKLRNVVLLVALIISPLQKDRQTEQRLKRLGKAYAEGLYSDEDYRRENRTLEDKLATLVVPEVDAAMEAGKLLEHFPDLRGWLLLPITLIGVTESSSTYSISAVRRQRISR